MRKADFNHRGSAALFTIVLLGALLLGFGRLPADLGSLPLEAQVRAYERHFETAVLSGPIERARSRISVHGWAAAELMAKYIRGESHGLPREEAIVIANLVEWRGSWLKESAVHLALRELAAKGSLSASEETAAKVALAAIDGNLKAGDGLDEFGSGPCQASPGPPLGSRRLRGG